jgi:uncharacterized protein YcbK (DUF882 family)
MIYKLSDLNRANFKAIEFYKSDTALKYNIDNNPKEQATLENLDILADKMQEVRDLLDSPIIITSGYRCLELNMKLTNSAKDSFHLFGLAADFIVKNKDPEKIVKLLSSEISVDKAIATYYKKNNRNSQWVHLQVQSNWRKNRNLYLRENITNKGIEFKKLD